MITVVTMVALVVFGIFALLKLQDRRIPRHPAAGGSHVAIPYPGASPDVVEREVLKPVEERSRNHRRRPDHRHRQRRLRADHDRSSCSRRTPQATQDVRDAISADPRRSAARDGGADLRGSIRPIADRLDHALVDGADSGGADAPRRSGHHARSARHPRRRAGADRRRRRARAHRSVEPQALQAAGVSVSEVVSGAPAAEPRRAGRPRERERSTSARSVFRDDSKDPRISRTSSSPSATGSSIRLGQVADGLDGTQEPRTLALYNGVEAIGIDIKKSKGYSTTEVATRSRRGSTRSRRRSRPARRSRSCRTPGHASRTRCATSRRRSSRARCSRCWWCSCS